MDTGLDEPFGGFLTEPGTTGQIMEFHVLPESCDEVSKPKDLVLSLAQLWGPTCQWNTTVSKLRDLALLKESSKNICVNEDSFGGHQHRARSRSRPQEQR